MFLRSPLLLWALASLFLLSCSEDDSYVPVVEPEQVSPVVFDLATVPYQNLSQYNFFDGAMAEMNPVYGVMPYELINPLFTDYAKKKRFVWMPSDVSASFSGDHMVLNFPVGTVLIKNFYYNNVLPSGDTRVIETRLMINKPEGWVFANYVWNEEQTDAVMDLNGSFLSFEWEDTGITRSVNYRIPAGPECHTCHKIGEMPIPIGPKPQNFNKSYNFKDGAMNQLQKMIDLGYLDDNLPDDINTLSAWNDPNASLNDRARAYIDINCAHCHQEEAHCAYRPVRFNYDATGDDGNLGVCVEPDTDLGVGLTHIVSPSNNFRSVMYYRINSTDEAVRMPLLGRTIIHEEGAELIFEWINSINTTCE
ncbi:MAG: hypothetical protein HKN00_13510 [Flavobacteriaceae bacterium]|nr:hypothetical protein [Flavobacteriaceae bacterium]